MPAGETAVRCPHCDRPFVRSRYRDLHVGLDHPEAATDRERDAFREAYADETDSIRLFRLKALALLVVLYFGFLFVYAFVG